MITSYWNLVNYEEYNGIGVTGQPQYKETKQLKALRLRGTTSINYADDGDSTSASYVYKTIDHIVPRSRINGREVIDCVKVEGFGRNCGYMSYVK
jgi:hypothetical protein